MPADAPELSVLEEEEEEEEGAVVADALVVGVDVAVALPLTVFVAVCAWRSN